MFDRRELLIGATAGIAQLGQRVVPRITLPALLDQSRVPALGGAAVTSKGPPAIQVMGRRRSGQHVGVERDDLWLIGSNTQAMTALLFGRLAEFGKTRFGAKLSEIFPDVELDDGWRGVAIDELMAHVGGVSDEPFATPEALHKWLTDTRPLSVQRAAFAKAVLTAPPRGRRGEYAFSNAGYVIVGAAIERATRLTWEACISSELFSPLALDSAGFGAPEGPEPWGHARLDPAHTLQVNPKAEADDPPVFGPASRVHLSLEDYARFVRLFLTGGGDYVDPKTIAHLAAPIRGEPSGPALGWLVSTERSWANGPVLQASTSSGYWSADVRIGPARDLAVIALCNAGGADFGGSAAQRLALSLIQSRLHPGA
jgi:CubicO group peptidase (beta-lactamase class C family)